MHISCSLRLTERGNTKGLSDSVSRQKYKKFASEAMSNVVTSSTRCWKWPVWVALPSLSSLVWWQTDPPTQMATLLTRRWKAPLIIGCQNCPTAEDLRRRDKLSRTSVPCRAACPSTRNCRFPCCRQSTPAAPSTTVQRATLGTKLSAGWPLRPHSHCTWRGTRSELPYCSNSAVHTACAKRCTTQCHVHNWRHAPFLRILIADENLSSAVKMISRRSKRQLRNMRRNDKQCRKFLMILCIIYQCFFAEDRHCSAVLKHLWWVHPWMLCMVCLAKGNFMHRFKKWRHTLIDFWGTSGCHWISTLNWWTGSEITSTLQSRIPNSRDVLALKRESLFSWGWFLVMPCCSQGVTLL